MMEITSKLNQLTNIHKLIEIKNLTKWFFHFKFASLLGNKEKSDNIQVKTML